jgi:hypothetical protein
LFFKTSAVFCFLVLPLCSFTTYARSPYPRSPVVTNVTWATESTIVRQARGSDNWAITWAADDNLYAGYGDGWGFDPRAPSKLSLGFAKVVGSATDFSGINIRSISGEQRGNGKKGKKASGMLMIDRILYMWVRNVDKKGEQSQLAWSSDYMKTWTWSKWKFEKFGYPIFLNFGKNYAGARDSYVYIYSPDTPSAYEETDTVVLARVPKNRVTDRGHYEFFKDLDVGGNPSWTTDIDQRGSVFTFPAGCNRLDVIYNAPRGRYLMTMRSRAKAGGLNQFSIYDSPEPWGPWTTVFYTENWDVDPGESQHLPTKWMSADGKTLHMVFSGNDSFSVRQATLSLTREATGGRGAG